jgi:hypothetical protein
MSDLIEPEGTKVFVSQGLISGVEYVDVVTAEGNPYEYGVPLAQAIHEYGKCRQVNNPSAI